MRAQQAGAWTIEDYDAIERLTIFRFWMVIQMSTRYSSAPLGSNVAATKPARARNGNMWMLSLTGICFVFGVALAMQLRSVNNVQKNKVEKASALQEQKKQAESLRQAAARAAIENAKSKQQIATLRAQLLKGGALSAQQLQAVRALNTRINSLQMAAALTPVTGAGIRITLDDNASAPPNADASSFRPDIVHDFDLLQTVNELRAANAEAISIRGVGQTEGTRVTAYTPIRCVGPVIQVAGEPVTSPFTVEAIGNAEALDKAVNMAGGILYNLKDPSRGPSPLQIKTEQVEKLTLPAASSGAPHFKVAKPVL